VFLLLAVAACVLANSNMQHHCIYQQAATCKESMERLPAAASATQRTADTSRNRFALTILARSFRDFTHEANLVYRYRRAVTTTLGSKKGLHAGAAASQRPRRVCRLVSGRGRQVGHASC
jgi:hypothetical protein